MKRMLCCSIVGALALVFVGCKVEQPKYSPVEPPIEIGETAQEMHIRFGIKPDAEERRFVLCESKGPKTGYDTLVEDLDRDGDFSEEKGVMTHLLRAGYRHRIGGHVPHEDGGRDSYACSLSLHRESKALSMRSTIHLKDGAESWQYNFSRYIRDFGEERSEAIDWNLREPVALTLGAEIDDANQGFVVNCKIGTEGGQCLSYVDASEEISGRWRSTSVHPHMKVTGPSGEVVEDSDFDRYT